MTTSERELIVRLVDALKKVMECDGYLIDEKSERAALEAIKNARLILDSEPERY
jgi:hypothetical protein